MNTRIVHLFVFETMADWEAAFVVSTIRNRRLESGDGYRVITAAASDAPITTMRGVSITPEVTLEAITPETSAMLILPGGMTWETGQNAEALQLASQFIAAGTAVAATCAATLALARAGVLDRLRLSGSSREYLISSGFRGAGFYCGVPSRADQSTDGAAPIDLAREIFRMLNLPSIAPTEPWHGMFAREGAAKYCAMATN